ncbi:MAG: PIN domain-containing protein [Nanoarchaeota archaeon]
MINRRIYFDSCIWLNLFKKEVDLRKGISYWKLSKALIEQIEEDKGFIVVSTIVLKELSCILGNKYHLVMHYFKEAECIKIIKTMNDDYDLARQFEQAHGFLSFYDYLHVAIAKRLDIP